MTAERRVLVIDDSMLIRRVAAIALAKHGWTVLDAESGRDGLAVAIEDHPDAILLDVEMPGLDGPATLRELRADPLTHDIPVLFLTGHAVDQDKHGDLRRLGADGVLAKPFQAADLAGLVAETLGWSL